MCIPDSTAVTQMAISLTKDTIRTFAENKRQKDNLEYRTQIAINNAKNAQDEAMRQKQLGIEESRNEKIESLKQAKIIQAQNSSNGFDILSDTSQLNIEDKEIKGYQEADLIDKQYDYMSNKYIKKANNYITNINDYRKKYNDSIYSNMYNAVGKFKKVSSDWFDNKGGLI